MAALNPKTLQVPLELIDIDDQALRHDPEDDSIIELAQDIAAKGLLQPIAASLKPDGRYQLRWGGRRLAAHRRLGLDTIWTRLWTREDISVKALAVVENLQRRDLTLAEEVEAVRFMTEDEGKSIEQIAAALSKTRSWVLNRVMVPELPDFLRLPLIEGDLPMSHVELISKIPDEGSRRYLAAQTIQNRWNKGQLRTIAESYMIAQAAPEPRADGISGIRPNTPAAPFYYICQLCQGKDTLDKFTLVRIHADGYGCRATPDRPTEKSGGSDGLDTDDDGHQRADS